LMSCLLENFTARFLRGLSFFCQFSTLLAVNFGTVR
jgi:hypothetical protein